MDETVHFFGFIETGCCRALEDLVVTTQPRLTLKKSAASQAGITGVHHQAQLGTIWFSRNADSGTDRAQTPRLAVEHHG